MEKSRRVFQKKLDDLRVVNKKHSPKCKNLVKFQTKFKFKLFNVQFLNRKIKVKTKNPKYYLFKQKIILFIKKKN